MRCLCKDVYKILYRKFDFETEDSYQDFLKFNDYPKIYKFLAWKLAHLICYLSFTAFEMIAFTLSATFVFGFLLDKIKATPKISIAIKILSFAAFIPLSLSFSYISMLLGFKITYNNKLDFEEFFDYEEDSDLKNTFRFFNLFTFLAGPIFQMISLFFALIIPSPKISNYSLLIKTSKIALFTLAANIPLILFALEPCCFFPTFHIRKKSKNCLCIF